jgi:hypothetical protein
MEDEENEERGKRIVKEENGEKETSSVCPLSLTTIWNKLVTSMVNTTQKYSSASLRVFIQVGGT